LEAGKTAGKLDIHLTLWCCKSAAMDAHCDAEKMKHPLKSVPKNMPNNEWLLKTVESFAEYTGYFADPNSLTNLMCLLVHQLSF
jgi:hypothetical protein